MLTAARTLLATLLLGSAAVAQGTLADYDRAASLAERGRGLVTGLLEPGEWAPDGSRLWYRVGQGGGQWRYEVVDCATGARTPVETGGRQPDSLAWGADGALLVVAEGQLWAWDAAAGVLVPAGDAAELRVLPDDEAQRASDTGGGACQLVFVNRLAEPLELFWLDFDGARQSYGRVEAGGRRTMGTYVGHRWVAVDAAGRDRGTWAGREGSWQALIDGTARPSPPRPARPDPWRSPDGRWQAFVRDHNLWLRAAEGGAEQQLSHDGRADDRYGSPPAWSPDSRWLAAMRAEPAQEHTVTLVESSPRDQVQPRIHTFDYLKPGDRVAVPRPQLFEVATQRQVPLDDALYAEPWSTDSLRWAPDSSRFTFVFNQRGHQVFRVLAVDPLSGEVRPLVEETSPTFICYSSKYHLTWLDARGELLWMSERDGWNHLYLLDAATGAVKRQLTQGPWAVRDVQRVDAEAGQVYFSAGGYDADQDPYYVHYFRVDLDTGALTRLTSGDGTHDLRWSPDRATYLDTWSRVDLPPRVELRRAVDGALISELAAADASALLATGWRAPERFVAPGRDGETPIHGVIIRPTNWTAEGSYPVIEDIYAGPQAAFVPKGWAEHYSMMELAELGFVVVKIDGMGTNYRSKAFHDVAWRNLADAGFPDRIAWLRAAAAADPSLDLGRVGLYGGSAGGQNALGGLLLHPDFYGVAVADCGCHDNRMDKIWWNEQWMGWPVDEHYAANSNVTLAPRLAGKLLLTVGELDRNVDPASTMQVVDALIRADKDFDLIVFPGAGHGAGGSAYGRRRMFDFFVRHLHGVEPRGR